MRGARCRIKPIGICSLARSDSHDRASRHLRARQLAAARAMAGFPVRAAGVEISRVDELLDRWVAARHGNRPCLISPAESWTYAQLAERVNRIANVLTRALGMVP